MTIQTMQNRKDESMKLPVETLIWRYENNLYQAAYSVLQNRADAQDAVQLAFIQYVQDPDSFESEEHIRRWLFRTVLNKAKDIRRSFWRRNRTDLDETIQNMSFEQPKDLDLFSAVSALPRTYRVVLQLYYYEEFSIREISQMLSISENAVKKRLSRARNLLKEKLDEEWEI